MIQAENLTKKFGRETAVDHLTFTVQPGIVTGFLGPNGAGKSTTMRMILGLDNPSAGTVKINGHQFVDSPVPMQEVGGLLDAAATHGGRSAYYHLLWQAQAGGIHKSRVDEVIDMVGLHDVAGKKVGGFSLGMRQRLGIASAMLGDPGVLLFDEPVNGLDPEGIRWIRSLLQRLAGEGRTVFVSSHLMSEMEETAEHVLVIGRGKLIADTQIAEFTSQSSQQSVRVVTPQAEKLKPILEERGAAITMSNGALVITGLDAPQVGELAAAAAIPLHELTPRRASLEAAFMEMTHDSVEYRADGTAPDAEAVRETARELAGERSE